MYFFVINAMSFYRSLGVWTSEKFSERPFIFCLAAGATFYVTLYGVSKLLSPIAHEKAVFWIVGIVWFFLVIPTFELAKADRNTAAGTAGFILSATLVLIFMFLL